MHELDSVESNSVVFHDQKNFETELRVKAARVLNALALLKWRLGGVASLVLIISLIVLISRQPESVPSPEVVAAMKSINPESFNQKSLYQKSDATTTTISIPIFIYVTGAISFPAVYEVAGDARVKDVVELAGGLSSDADLQAINLAEKVIDGQHIQFPRIGEANQSGVNDSSISINQAGPEDLEKLDGVGPSTAKAIVDYRKQNGPFRSVDQLSEIKGIGPSKLEQIKKQARL